MKGSEKQIKWEKSIQEKAISSLEKGIEIRLATTNPATGKVNDRNKKKAQEYKEAIQTIKSIDSAAWLIDHRLDRDSALAVNWTKENGKK